MKKIVGLWVMYMLCTSVPVFAQVDTSYIYNTSMPYGTLDLRIRKSDTRYYYLQEDVTFSFRESAPGAKTNTYTDMTSWDSSPYRQGNLREKNGSQDLFVMNYRVLFPTNYDPAYDPGYPIIIMLHGYGERGNCWFDNCYWSTTAWNPNTNSPPAPTTSNHILLNNDHNLLHGGNPHLAAVNRAGTKLPDDPTLAANAFQGFVLFPQVMNGWQQTARVEEAIKLLRLFIKKYNIDENRVYIHGLSNGGGGVFQAIKRAPWLFSAALAMSAVTNANIYGDGLAPEVGKLPMWLFQGGKDTNPTPSKSYLTVKQFREAGSDIRYYLYPNLGHGTWNTAYNEPDFFSWIRSKKKTQPHVFYGNPVICNTTGAGVRIGFSKGFFAYQWEFDGQVVANANEAEYVATSPGTVRGRFSRKPNPREEDWEPWSEPIVVSEISPAKPTIEVTGSTHLRGPGLPSTTDNNTVTFKSNTKAELYNWYKNGVPVEFPGTDVYDTLSVAKITSANANANGVYTLRTSFSYCPSPPSDPVYVFFNNSAPQNMTIDRAAAAFSARIVNSGVLLSWNDLVSKESAYEIWRKKSTDTYFTFVGKAPADALSYFDKILQPNTIYQYKLRAVGNAGVSNYLPSNTLTDVVSITTPADHKPPMAPQQLRVTANTLNTLTLEWKAAEDNAAISHYVINYGNNAVSTDTALTSFTLTGLPQNSLIPITVKAVDYAGLVSPASNQVVGSTYVLGLRYKHSTGAWEDLDDPTLVATWADPEFVGTINNFTLAPRTQEDYFNFQFTGYLDVLTSGQYLFRLQSGDGSRLFIDNVMVIDNDGIHGNVTKFSDTLTLSQGPHSIEVQYFEYAGAQSLTLNYKGPVLSNSYKAIPDSLLRSGRYVPPVAPAAPTGLTATATGMQRVDLTWNAAGAQVEIYRATATDGEYIILGKSDSGTFADTVNTWPGKTYYYKARTLSSNAVSAFSNVVSATTTTDNVPPSVPANLALLNKSHTAVSMAWTASTDNTAVSHYEILANGVVIGTSDVTTYLATALEPNAAYSFTVVAVDANNNKSAASTPLVVNTNPSAIYYSLATGNLNDPNTWRQNADGSGSAPSGFGDNGQYFIISNRTTTTTGGPWEVDGSASKVVVPSGVTLTIDQEFIGKLQIDGTGIVNINNGTTPELTNLSPQSTINFNAASNIPAGNYGNVNLNGPATSKTFADGTISIVGNLVVANGVSAQSAGANSTVISIGGNVTLNGGQGLVPSDNRPALIFPGGQHMITASDDIFLYSIELAENGSLAINTTSPRKLIVGSSNGGGLKLKNGSRLNVGQNSLHVVGEAVVNPDGITGVVAVTGGNVKVRSLSTGASNLYFDASAHLIDTLLLESGGSLAIQSSADVQSALIIKKGILTSNGNVRLLSSATKSAVIAEIDNGNLAGTVRVQKYTEPVPGTFHELATSVNGVTVSDWQQFFPVTGPFTGSSGGADPSMFVSNGSTTVAFPSAGQSNQVAVEGGKGYMTTMSSSQPFTIEEEGNIFQGTFIYPLIGGTTINTGVNLLGNAFASPVYWRRDAAAWTMSGVGSAIALKENVTINGNSIGRYRYHSSLIGETEIKQGQGFWLQAYSANPSLAMTEKAKTKLTVDTVHSVYARVVLAQGDFTDEALLIFNEDATDDFDGAFDFIKRPNEGLFDVSTRSGNNNLAVNTLSSEYCSKAIPVNIQNASPGNYILKLESLTAPGELGDITLTDNFTHQTVNFQSAYAFAITSDAQSSGANRFIITFSRKPVDIASPVVNAETLCSGEMASVSITNAQLGAVYEVVDSDDKIIGTSEEATSASILIQIPVALLDSGVNHIRVRASFPGCGAALLNDQAELMYVKNFNVTVPDDFSVCLGEQATLTASGVPQGGQYKWYDGDGQVIAGETANTLQTIPITRETIYQVGGVLASGCESTLQTIHVYADSLTVPTIIFHNDTLVTQVDATYQWYLNGNPIAGAVKAYYVPTESGSYTVVASSSNCSKTSDAYQYILDPGCTLDLSTPQASAALVCGNNAASITISHPQNGVSYFVIDGSGETISSVEVANGSDVHFEIGPDALQAGRNELRIRADLTGCVNRVLNSKAVFDYVPVFTLTTEDTISVCKGSAAVLSAAGGPEGATYRWENENNEVIGTTASLTIDKVESLASYYVTATHPLGCESEKSKVVVTPSGLAIPIIFVNGTSLYTSALGSYQWKLNGEAIPMAVNQTFTPTASGVYTVEINFNGCTAESLPMEFFVTGTEEAPSSEFVMNIYPVPSSTQSLTVRIQSPSTHNVLIRVLDISGRTLLSRTFTMSQLNDGLLLTDASVSLKDGIYYIIATQDRQEIRRKIIVKN